MFPKNFTAALHEAKKRPLDRSREEVGRRDGIVGGRLRDRVICKLFHQLKAWIKPIIAKQRGGFWPGPFAFNSGFGDRGLLHSNIHYTHIYLRST